MGSYVISVSLGTGCYRHIQIAKSATLYQLHKAILDAFEFVDDHAHAFFMDNRIWSEDDVYYSMKVEGYERLTKGKKLEKLGLRKGSQFKYVFDFGEEWRFQCKVLRELEDDTKKPAVIRIVGESPEQYPEPDWDDEDGNLLDTPLDELPEELIGAIYDSLPLSEGEISLLREYIEAAANLYGLISLDELLEIYNAQNAPVDPAAFLVLTALIDCEDNSYTFITRNDMPSETPEEALAASELVDNYLFVEDPETDIRALRRQQQGKPRKIMPKTEFLRFTNSDYFPDTPARTAMLEYLRRREASLSLPADAFCSCLQRIIVIDAPMQEVINIVTAEGLVFDKHNDIGEFTALCQNLNSSTHKHANRGHTPDEIFAISEKGKKLAERAAPPGQISLFDNLPPKPKLTIVGSPSRNGPCPCGSGRKYKNCCGK